MKWICSTRVDCLDYDTIMLMQEAGCHNINLVSPTHVLAAIIAAVYLAAQSGLHIPLVYNTGGYDSAQGLDLLDGIIDIYMPDMKYANAQVGLHYSKVHSYPQVNQAAVREMHRQVGDLRIDERGLGAVDPRTVRVLLRSGVRSPTGRGKPERQV